MDLKKKLKSLLNNKKVNEENGFEEEEWLNDAGVVKLKHCTLGVRDPKVDKEALESIEKPFFEDEHLDPVQVQLSKFKELPDQQLIETVCATLKVQLQAVSRKISDLVLENQSTYSSELKRVSTLQQDLHTALQMSLDSRRSIKESKETFTTAGLKLLANHRKRVLLRRLLSSLHTIKTLQKTDKKLKELLKEENFPGAINLSLEYQEAASTYKHYHCISELSNKLNDNSEMVDEALDVALSRICLSFNHQLYTRIQQAYRLLGKSQVATDQLHMHYISCVHVVSFKMVLKYVGAASGQPEEAYQEKQFQELCACLKPHIYVACLVELCSVLWKVVDSYKHTVLWHAQHDNEDCFFDQVKNSNAVSSVNESNNKSPAIDTTTIKNNTDSNEDNKNNATTNVNESTTDNTSSDNRNNDLQQLDLTSIHYVRKKLEAGKFKLWSEIQQKLKTLLLAQDLSHFQYEEFMRVLDVVNKLTRVGSDFCESTSESLGEALVLQSGNYFKKYHQARMDEMKAFVENEGWVLYPVKNSFKLTQFQEFKFMKEGRVLKEADDCSSTNPFIETVTNVSNVCTNNHNHYGEEEEEDEDDDDDDASKGEYVDEECRNGNEVDEEDDYPWNLTKAVKRKPSVIATRSTPLLTNLTFNVCKFFGRYIHMMSSLQCITHEVIKSMTQLIDFYFYAVYETFSDEKYEENLKVSHKLRVVIDRVKNSINIESPPIFPTHHTSIDLNNNHSIDSQKNSMSLDLSSLKPVVVATESLMFLVTQFTALKSHLYDAMPEQQRGLLDQYFIQTLCVMEEVRDIIYKTYVRKNICNAKVLTLMASVAWDIDDIMSLHSPYVDVLLQEVSRFKMALVDFSLTFPLPNKVVECIWKEVSLLCCETLLEGFSSCKKCSNEGRALMMLDFQQFLLKFYKLSSLRPVPGQGMVEGYVKAFYLPEAELEKWISKSSEYSIKQLNSLVQCLNGLSRKTRHKLLTLVEEDRLKR